MKADGNGNREGLNKNISLALCTYNGASFLKDLLGSVSRQSLQPAEVVVCDDCSSDDSVKILMDFASGAAFPVHIYENKARLSVVANFSQALSLCRGDYVAVCDQDDIWLEDRLARSFRAMEEAENQAGANYPLLVHSDLKVGDRDGKVVANSFMKENRLDRPGEEPLKRLLVQNFVTGCTVLLNRPLLERALPIPADALMHDWWLALVAAVKGEIIYLPEVTVIYRQHGTNVVGSRSFFSAKTARRLIDLTALEKDIAAVVKQGLALQTRLNELQDNGIDNWQAPEYLDTFLDKAQQGGVGAACTARRLGIKKTPWLRNFLFQCLLTRGAYVKYL